MIRHIRRSIDRWNDNSTPFVWTREPAAIIEKVLRHAHEHDFQDETLAAVGSHSVLYTSRFVMIWMMGTILDDSPVQRHALDWNGNGNVFRRGPKAMRCFVIMPYGNRAQDARRKQELDSLYEHFIKPAVEAVALPGHAGEHVRCHRGDKEPGPGEIVAHIVENLVCSELAIADLTGRNPNVFYELGVRHAVSDNTILISESEEDVPFDLRGQRLILYTRDFEGGGRLRTDITKAVQEVVREPGRIDNPVRRFLFEREREKAIQQHEASGRRPEDDFVGKLLQEMNRLRTDFSAQLEEVRSVMQAVTAEPRASGSAPVVATPGDLSALEGAWRVRQDGSHVYARIVNGELLAPYCFSGNDSLTAHLYNVRRIGDTFFARFQWFTNPDVSGYVMLRVEGPDLLVGGWWYANRVSADLANDITRIDPALPGMQNWGLRRIKHPHTPDWAENYFQKPPESQATDE